MFSKDREELTLPVYEREKDVLYIHLPREFDHFTSRNMKVDTEALIEAAGITRIMFDFEKTEFMDSTGIGILLGRYKRMKGVGGTVYIRHVNRRIRKMLEIAGIMGLTVELKE